MQNNLQNSTSQCLPIKYLGPSVRICQLNIEGSSKGKNQCLSKILLSQNIDIVAVQETHIATKADMKTRGIIHGYTIIGSTFHHAHGITTYARSDIENVQFISTEVAIDIHQIIINFGGIKVLNIYKPPNTKWQIDSIPPLPHPAVYTGDFNSHNTLWGYESNDTNGVTLSEWAESANAYLIFDAKDRKSFYSTRWGRDYNPDLCFVSSDETNRPLNISRKVLEDFPHSQHRPIVLEVGHQIPITRSTPRPRWNFGKADWASFAKDLDKYVRWIPPTPGNYRRFTGAVIAVGKRHIPRCFRKEYIPGWTEDSDRLYKEFTESGDTEIADELIESLNNGRLQKWRETVEEMDFIHSSRKAWSLLRKLGGSTAVTKPKETVSPNKIAEHIVHTSRLPPVKAHSRRVKQEHTNLRKSLNTNPPPAQFSWTK